LSTAKRLILISCNDNLREGARAPHLPAAWAILYELTKLSDEQFDNGINSGVINPQMQRKDVNALRGADHAGRLSVEIINRQFREAGGSYEEYGAAVKAAIAHGWITLHPSGACPSFTQEHRPR
jgi:hypothetical protein